MNRALVCLMMALVLAAPAGTAAPATQYNASSASSSAMSATQAQSASSVAAPAAPAPSMLPKISLNSDLSIASMVGSADGVVKTIMVLLALASVATWTLLIVKCVELRQARIVLRTDLQRLDKAASILALGPVQSEVTRSMLEAVRAEMTRSGDLRHSVHAEGLKERVGLRLQSLETAWARRMMLGVNVVASIGATAPFVGLFGTVWGIMNSFMGIVRAHATNLAVVAPGIAEALLTTAIGLAVAVPAVLIYNSFTRSLSGYRALLADTTNATACLVSLEIEQAQAAGERVMAPLREAVHGV